MLEKNKYSNNENSKKPKIPTHILDDLTLRFIINSEEFIHLHPEEYFFIVEEAYWFALDFYCIKYLSLIDFTAQLFEHNGLSINSVSDYFKFKQYKQLIKVYGAILFSPDFKSVLVVQQSSGSYTFPKGKKSKNESGMDCAVRETLEEVGYDAKNKIVDISTTIFDKLTFYCVFNVKTDFPFKTMTRNEISKIFWMNTRNMKNFKDNKDYKILYSAYKGIEAKVNEIRENLFHFDLDKIKAAMD